MSIPIVAGVVLAVVLALSARLTRFDLDRSFYPTILIVIATYYVVFAFMSGEAIWAEIVAASVFAAFALAGVYFLPVLVGLGIVLHGAFDFIHPRIIDNGGVPSWWAAFCGSVDVVLGTWVIWLARRRNGS